MPYDPQLPGCFGENDSEFGLHPLDQDRAFEWLADLRKRQVDWIDAKEQVQDFFA